MISSRLLGAAVACVALSISSNSHATAVSGQGTWETTLQPRDLDGNPATIEAYYDTDLNITWLTDANYAVTSGYVTDGRLTWADATSWASTVDPYGSGIMGWRLPETVDVGNDGCTYTNFYQGVDCGYNITTHSELSHMFYVTLGNLAAWTTDPNGVFNDCAYGPNYGYPDYCLTNTGNFSNLQPVYYWSGTEYVADTTKAWVFNYSDGEQASLYKTNIRYAWIVHDGAVGAAIVPAPAAMWLFGSGLLGFVGLARRKKVA